MAARMPLAEPVRTGCSVHRARGVDASKSGGLCLEYGRPAESPDRLERKAREWDVDEASIGASVGVSGSAFVTSKWSRLPWRIEGASDRG